MSTASSLKLRAGAVILAFAGGLLPVATQAGSSTGNLSVSASVAQKCTIGAGTLAFGAYDPVGTNAATDLDQSGTMTVTCTKGATGITVGFGASSNDPAGCAAPQRCLASSGNYLNYQLYSDSSRSSVWTTAIAETVSGGTSSPTTLTVYGRIPKAQDASVGASYADTVVATVNY
jgi:spore coat protein U-like protein